jgi:hypothetical protein
MTVTYHAGRRIQATQADFDGTPSVSAGWKELGRTTLGSCSTEINVTSLPDKRYYMIVRYWTKNTTRRQVFKFNNDASTYAGRWSDNGSESNESCSIGYPQGFNGVDTSPHFTVEYVANKSDLEKLAVGSLVAQTTAGAANAPSRQEYVGKYDNTTDAIDEVNLHLGVPSGNGSFDSGSEVVVLGYDPDDTHTTNFWEELASVELGSAGDSFDTGTFTAKKYLWIQVITLGTGAIRTGVRLGNGTVDSGANYAIRRSHNGAADSTFTSGTFGVVSSSGATSNDNEFINTFVINNASNEKLTISHYNRKNTSGAGNVPNRGEVTGKWANTSNQCNIIGVHNDQGGDFAAGSIIKVWGSD